LPVFLDSLPPSRGPYRLRLFCQHSTQWQIKGSKSDGPRKGYRFLDLGSGNEVTLYPTIVSMICPAAMRETHFIDAWDQGRNVARMKSFEKGHAMSDPGVPGALVQFG
jgi:hypothetical protein